MGGANMRKQDKRYHVTITLDRYAYELLRLAAAADCNSPEYELRIAVRKGLEQLTGTSLEEDE